MGSCSFLSKITADVFPPQHHVNTHLNARDQQNICFHSKAHTANDQLIVKLVMSTWLLLTHSVNICKALVASLRCSTASWRSVTAPLHQSIRARDQACLTLYF